MVQAPPRPRKRRLTQAQALQQVREQIKEAESRLKPKRVADEDSTETRDRDRHITLPKHLAQYVGEQAVVSQGYVWSHRPDWKASWVDDDGVKHTPVRPVCLGPTDALDPNYRPGHSGLSQSTIKGCKNTDFVLSAEATCTNDHLPSLESFDTPRGRPRIDHLDDLILDLTAEGRGVKAVARSLRNRGYKVSYSTISRRLMEMKRPRR
jgi:hypothetical protein